MTHSLLEELSRQGIAVSASGGNLRLRGPKAAITPEVLERVRLNKAELLVLLNLSKAKPRLKYPDSETTHEEAEEVALRVEEEGYVLLWSTVLEDLIAFYWDEEAKAKIPPGFVPYSVVELEELFNDFKPPLPISTLKLIHEAKKYGGRVIERKSASE